MPVVNTDITTNAASTPGFTLASAQTLVVGREATISALGDFSEGVRATATGNVIVFGEVFSLLDSGIRMAGSGDVDIAEGAHVYGLNGVEFNARGLLRVAGTLIGDVTGVLATSPSFELDLVNTGEIHGGLIGVSVTGPTTITNFGLISGASTAVLASASGSFLVSIDNAGSILSDDGFTALDLRSSSSTARREVRNTGLIIGDVELSQGGDVFDSTGGRVHGRVLGYGGADLLLGSLEGDELMGDVGADTLAGAEGDDVLNGGRGADRIDGGAGFDVVRFFNTVTASLADQGENTGEAAGDSYVGVEGLRGDTGADHLIGNGGANLLDTGDSAFDTLDGGGGDDRYVVAFSPVILDSGGFDTVDARGSFVLAAGLQIEVIRAATGFNISLTGNERNNRIVGGDQGDVLTGADGADTIQGGDGNDTLVGGASRDRLVGGDGADRFTFETAVGQANADRILNFDTAADVIALENAVFAGLPAGALAADAFKLLDGSAVAPEDRILYDPGTGELFFDADGSGSGGRQLFATLTGAPGIVAADFLVV